MKILIVNTYDKGGAANSCKRLHWGLLNAGVESKVLLKAKTTNWPNTFQFISPVKPLSFSEKIRNKSQRIAKELKLFKPKNIIDAEQVFLKNRSAGLEMFSFPQSSYDITESKLYLEADIINLHWAANFIDFQSFFKKNTKPVVWTLHDMNPFTGGDHYKERYLGIDNAGRPLKREISKEEKFRSESNLELKKEALRKIKNLTIVAPSPWMADEAKKSALFNSYPVHHIPYGLDRNIYKSLDKTFARYLFNIPENKKVILFVADSIDNQRKGFTYLERALKQIKNKDLVLCSVGSKEIPLSSSDNLIDLGPIADERLMAIAYSAADVFIIPSLMDNMPNTVLESLMCGTPVIGFPVGGIKEMIKPGENGLLTGEISVSSLRETIEEFLKQEKGFDGNLIRENAIKKYDQKVQANSYISLFGDILGKV